MYVLNFNFPKLSNILVLSLLVPSVACHECYVCGVGDNSVGCDAFDGSQREVCPKDVTSCSLHLSGDMVIARTCGEIVKLTDCKVANRIKYCYCSTNLCNGGTNITPTDDTDDEDLLETGSGSEAPPSTTAAPGKPRANDSATPRAALLLFMTVLVFI